MISADLRFEGFDSRSWTNLISLFAPGVVERMERAPAATDAPETDRDEARRHGGGNLFIVTDDEGNVLKALHSRFGRVRDLDYRGPDDMAQLARDYRAYRCVVLREGVLEELAERMAVRMQRGDDYLTQWLVLLRALRELIEADLIRIWPRPFANVPIPNPGTVRRAFDLVMPDEHSFVAMLWDRGQPWTSLALRRRAGEIDLVAGPDLISRWTGPLGGDWRRDHRVVSEAVAHAVAPVHLGVFSEAETVRSLLRNPDPGAWTRAVAVRDVIMHPAPPYVSVALGADALRAVAASSARMLGGIDLLSALGPVGEYVRGRVAEVASVSSTLGFNPLRLLGTALQRSESGGVGDEPPAEPQGDPRER